MFYVLAVAAVACFGFGMALANPHFAFAGAGAAAYVFVSLLRGRHAADVIVEESGLQFSDQDRDLPYDAIQGVRLNQKTPVDDDVIPPAGELEILGEESFVFCGWSSHAGVLYRHLLNVVPATGSPDTSAKLEKHLADIRGKFSDDLIYTYRARSIVSRTRSPIANLGLALLLAGIVALAATALTEQAQGWAVSYLAWGVLLSSGALADAKQRRTPFGVARWEGCALVVSPWGIAVDQKDLIGKMPWNQIRQITPGILSRKFYVTRPQASTLTITIDGATIYLPDMYDRPLAIIYRILKEYWDSEQEESPPR